MPTPPISRADRPFVFTVDVALPSWPLELKALYRECVTDELNGTLMNQRAGRLLSVSDYQYVGPFSIDYLVYK
jgi:hypothetical protein